jgi:hypothetical protein
MVPTRNVVIRQVTTMRDFFLFIIGCFYKNLACSFLCSEDTSMKGTS